MNEVHILDAKKPDFALCEMKITGTNLQVTASVTESVLQTVCSVCRYEWIAERAHRVVFEHGPSAPFWHPEGKKLYSELHHVWHSVLTVAEQDRVKKKRWANEEPKPKPPEPEPETTSFVLEYRVTKDQLEAIEWAQPRAKFHGYPPKEPLDTPEKFMAYYMLMDFTKAIEDIKKIKGEDESEERYKKSKGAPPAV